MVPLSNQASLLLAPQTEIPGYGLFIILPMIMFTYVASRQSWQCNVL